MSVEVLFRPIGGSGLVGDYLQGREEAPAFFASSPFDLQEYRRRAAQLEGRFPRERREAAAAALHPTSDAARLRLAQWVERGGAVVTTGQQAGLFTGPLYTIYKALTAARLASELEARLGITVLPVFWTASEDHDWAEVNHTYLLDRRDDLTRLELRSDDALPLPMSERLVGGDVASVLEAAELLLAGEPHAAWVVELLRDAYRPAIPMADAFRALLDPLLASSGFCITDAADPALKRASLPVLHRELLCLEEHEALLRGTAQRMTASGYAVQVPVLPSASNLFVRTRYGRERLLRDVRGWISRDTGTRFSESELEARLQDDPTAFSPNVLLRPVVESHVFPVLAYVAGPGEIAYWAQLAGLFRAHRVGMPAVYPRASATLIEPRAQELLQRTGLSLDDLARPRHELVTRHARLSIPGDVAASIRELREGIVRQFDRLATRVSGLDSTLTGAVTSRRNRALLEIHEVERKVVRAVARTEHGWTSTLDATMNHLLPLAQPQDRVLNVLPFLARHGGSLLDRIAEGITVSLEPGAPPADSTPGAG